MILFIVLSLFIGLNIYVFSSSRVCSDAYLASFLDKTALLDNTKSPKIILVGDSSLAFGIDSSMIAEEFNMPVINTGIQGAVGLLYSMNSVKPYVGEGDIVVLSTAYEQWFEGNVRYGDQIKRGSLWQLLLLDFSNIRYITHPTQVVILLKSQIYEVTYRLEQGLFVETHCINRKGHLSRSKFNANGDYIGHLNQEPPGKDFSKDKIIGTITQDVFDEANQFAHDIEVAGANLYFVAPPLAQSVYEISFDALEKFIPTLQQGLDFPVLGETQQFVYPDTMMHDTLYHTNAEGRKLRTYDLIQLLSENISQPK